MRYGRVVYQGKPRYCTVIGESVTVLKGDLWDRPTESELTLPIADVKFLSPVLPSKIVAVGLNYRDHVLETGSALPGEPLIFLKPSTAVIGPDDAIVLPKGVGRVDYEAELAVVIGRQAKCVSVDQASDYILGYTCLNDVTARGLQQKDGQWTRSKSFDTFAPLGPWVDTEADPANLAIELRVNGDLRQRSNTDQLVFDVSRLVSHISYVMTLLPGDVIATGTPAGIGPLRAGDSVEVSIDRIGTLRNRVIE